MKPDRAIFELASGPAAATDLWATPSTLKVTIAGRELFLDVVGLPPLASLKKKFPLVNAQFTNCSGAEAFKSYSFRANHPFSLRIAQQNCEYGLEADCRLEDSGKSLLRLNLWSTV